jgi:hypothetical protein
MAIRLANSCAHCEALSAQHQCKVHDIKVDENYVCDHFSFNPSLSTVRHCGSCARHKTDTCAHPQKAAQGMLCSSWAPQA